MRKNLFVLIDGTEICSGIGKNPAITSVTYTQMVNDATDLEYGAACAGMIEAALLDTSGAFSLSAGDELAYYSVAEDGTRSLMGYFTAESPTKPSANTCKFTAYDRMIRFDKDLSMWMASLTEWPYTMIAFLSMVCEQCGVELEDSLQLINGDFPIMRFIQQVTGRQLIKWIAGANAAFATMTPEGKLTFSTYTDVGNLDLPVKSLKLADYSTGQICQAVVKQTEDDVGVAWPMIGDGKLEILMGNTGNVNYDYYFGSYAGKVLYELEYRIQLNGCTDLDPKILIARGIDTDGQAKSLVNLKIYVSSAGKMTFGAYDGDGEHPTDVICENGRPYKITLAIDPETDTYDFYADGKEIIGGGKLRDDAVSFNGVRLTIHKTGGAAPKAVYDNIIVTTSDGVVLMHEDFNDPSLEGWKHASSKPEGVDIDVNSYGEVYTILANPLLATPSTALLTEYVQRIAQRVVGMSYIPAEVQLLDPRCICRPGTFITVTDRHGNTRKVAAFSVQRRGEIATVKCTGNPSRSGPSSLNGRDELKVLQGRVAQLRVGLEEVSSGLSKTTIDVEDVKSKQSSLKQTVDGIESRVSITEDTAKELKGQYTFISQRADGIDLSVSTLRGEVGTKAEQSQVHEIAEHFRFDSDGMTITNSGTGMGIGVSEQRVVFTGGNDPTTVITPNTMETTNLSVGIRLDLGEFSFIPRTNQNLSLRYIGG